MIQKFLVLMALVILCSTAFAAENMYWLRGQNATVEIEGQEQYMLSSTPATSLSTETIVDVDTLAGTHELVSWYSMKLPAQIMISGDVHVWFKRTDYENDNPKYSFELYEYNPFSGKSTMLAQSDWHNFAGQQVQASARILSPHILSANNRLKLVIYYKSEEGGGSIKIYLDKPSTSQNTTWITPSGSRYTAKGVEATAAIMFALCSETPVCSNDSDCDDQEELTTDICINPGSCQAYCYYDWCTPECISDIDCDDLSPNTIDECIYKGTCRAECKHTECSIACHSNAGCDDGNPLTTDTCTKAGTCNARCSNVPCYSGCSSNSDCDDDNPATTDLCIGAGACGAECVRLENYNDGVCDSDETKCSVPNDCGTCSGDVPLKVCYEYGCVGANCKELLKKDCCGNGVCETNEDFLSCGIDCKPQAIQIELTSFTAASEFMRGDTLPVVVSVTVDSHAVSDAEVYVKGFFGRKRLRNTGTYGDAKPNDNVYGFSFTIPENISEGEQIILIEVRYKEKVQLFRKSYIVNPKLDISINKNKDNYILGDIIQITGQITKHEQPIAVPIDVNLVDSKKNVILQIVLETDEQGNYTFSYHTNLLEPLGVWKIAFYANDSNGNYLQLEADLNLLAVTQTSFLQVAMVSELLPEYSRGETIDINVEVKDYSGAAVDDAEVTILTPLNQKLVLAMESSGLYRATFWIPWQTPQENQKFQISAVREAGGAHYSGQVSFDLNFLPIEINIEIVAPEATHYSVGEEINFTILISYPDKSQATNVTIAAHVNDNPVEFTAVGQGKHEAAYIVGEGDEGKTLFSAETEDIYGNTGQTELELEISGTLYIHYIRKYSQAIIFLTAAIIISLLGITSLSRRRRSLKVLLRREAELRALIKDLQSQYFKEGALSRKYYQEMISKYEIELSDVLRTIEQIRFKLAKKKVKK